MLYYISGSLLIQSDPVRLRTLVFVDNLYIILLQWCS